ncbi:sensor histidine kinase [Xanthocytophaga agilis]|uniref:histidine kinase n=1 Tax=Xanthocytophaga agilis TaxID=3048010 RepID=A0AAE3R922_9BACT|nr:sensor histidine kinase [Xanthocytophaga agilis]MDJ1505896.1 sensor histidine kinase [Xanthocytophaga agilis]
MMFLPGRSNRKLFVALLGLWICFLPGYAQVSIVYTDSLAIQAHIPVVKVQNQSPIVSRYVSAYEIPTHQQYFQTIAVTFGLISCMLLAAFLGLFWYRRDYKPPLYFAFVCLLSVGEIITNNEEFILLFVPISLQNVVRLNYLFFALIVFAFASHIRSAFSRLLPRWFYLTIGLVCSPVAVLALVSPLELLYGIFQGFSLFTLVVTLYSWVLLVGAWRQKVTDSREYLLGFSAVLLAFVNDWARELGLLHTGPFLPLGLFIFVALMAFALSRGTVRTLHRLKMISQLRYEQNHQLKHLNHELDRFVYQTSHDLRAPIASLMSLLELIRQESEENQLNTDQLQLYMELGQKVLKKQDKVIAEILKYSLNRRLQLQTQTIDWEQQITDVVSGFKKTHLINETVIIRTDFQISGHFVTDPDRVELILSHLIDNAIRYRDYSRELSIVDIKVTSSSFETLIEVRDNGIGIATQYQTRVFDMFFRASERSEGAGLGLYLAAQAVDKLKGTIGLESTENQGSCFRVRLPNLERQ